jgi:heat-inducible transcriptional repressor
MDGTQNQPELTERAKNVLRTLIREYVRAGRPIGSRLLAKVYQEDLSPATLRNVMADLEEAGYLAHPHTSAGRIPTRRGYRFYVESLLGNAGLSVPELDQIRTSLEEETDPADLMSKTSQLLSIHTNSIGFVLSPPISSIVMKHIEFVRLSNQRVLVLLVGEGGMVQHKMVQIKDKLSQSALDQAGRYLVEHFSGMNLISIRSKLLKLMSREKALYDRLLQNVTLLGCVALASTDEIAENEPEVYLDGTSRIVRHLANPDSERLFALLRTFEEKNRLIRIITECLKEANDGPSVTIGLEQHIPGMNNWTLITSPYSFDCQTSGS